MYLLTEATVDELKRNAISGLTRTAMEDRMHGGNAKISLVSAVYDTEGDTLELDFDATSTDGSEVYSNRLKFYKVNDKLGIDIENVKYSELEKKIRSVLHGCSVRLYSDDPSFLWQGCWEGLADNDLSLYKFKQPHGSGIWHDKHMASGGLNNREIHLTKHLAQIVTNIDSYVPYISQMLETQKNGH